MTDTSDALSAVPAGFTPHERRSPLTEPWEPIYSRTSEDRVILALRASAAHTNSRGFVHGGLLSALADNAMGISCGRALDPSKGLVTVSLTLDFLKVAAIGQWIEFDTSFIRTGATLCFAQAFVRADEELCARANGVFRVVDRERSKRP
jgi:uncharacterized protein (TIGR00369 family)